MSDKDLFEKRIKPAFNKMYTKVESAFTDDFNVTPTYDMIVDVSLEYGPDWRFPYDAYYLSDQEFTEILNEAQKGLRGYWMFPYNSQIIYTDDEIGKMKSELESLDEGSFEYRLTLDKINSNETNKRHMAEWRMYSEELDAIWEDLDTKRITRKEATKLETKLAKKYGCIKKSHEKSKIAFFLALDSPTPTCSYDTFSKVKGLYGELHNKIQSGLSFDDALTAMGDVDSHFAKILRNMHLFQEAVNKKN